MYGVAYLLYGVALSDSVINDVCLHDESYRMLDKCDCVMVVRQTDRCCMVDRNEQYYISPGFLSLRSEGGHVNCMELSD